MSQHRALSRGSSQGSFLRLPVFSAPGIPGANTVSMCPKWFVKFYAGDFSLDNAPWSGRPVEIDSDQIETLRKISVIPKWMLFKAVDAVHQGKAFASLDNLSGYYLQF